MAVSDYTDEEFRKKYDEEFSDEKQIELQRFGKPVKTKLKTYEEWTDYFLKNEELSMQDRIKASVVYTLNLAKQIRGLHKRGWIELSDIHEQAIATIIGKIETDPHFITCVFQIYKKAVVKDCTRETIFEWVRWYFEKIGQIHD